jgi:excisionase family DNA binding protein
VTDALLTAEQAAAILSVPTSWVYQKTREGVLPHVKIGRYRRYRQSSLIAWVDSNETQGRKDWTPRKPRGPS